MTKMRSLSVSRNPLERLQEIEAEMEPATQVLSVSEAKPLKTLPQLDERTHARTNAPTNGSANARTHARTSGSGEGKVETAALSQLLAAPLDEDPSKGPFHAATVRMPIDVWKRVGWVASFKGRTKQEVIGEALISYLERVRKESRS